MAKHPAHPFFTRHGIDALIRRLHPQPLTHSVRVLDTPMAEATHQRDMIMQRLTHKIEGAATL
jgi:hypothetical protein